ncbi:MAG: HlyD family efflux transporter periplasmic adaptor subunit [Succinivibrio sp.]|nr:HlyD family efflux transporter periplasmic adaptor subunit [Succinivibrio sp.]
MSEKINALKHDPLFRTVMFFIVVLCLATLLILLGRRNDAVTKAQIYHAGVITADTVNTAFENVGGKLIVRKVNESDRVKAGDLLLEVESRDLGFTISNLESQLRSLDAQIRQQTLNIENALNKLETTQEQTWRDIEELDANLISAMAAAEQAQAEYQRYEALKKTSSVSQSAYDSARRNYLQADASRISLLRNLQKITVGATQEQIEKLKQQHSAQGMTLSAILEKRADIENERNALLALESSRDALSAQLSQQRLNKIRTKLFAPEDGKVQQVMFEVGELVQPGATAILLETDRYYYDVYLSEYAAVKYQEGGTVEGYVPALDKTVKGKIRFIEAAPSFADLRMTREQGQADLTSFKMRIYTDHLDQLRPGMTVEIKDE